jgi:hypothetical protein
VRLCRRTQHVPLIRPGDVAFSAPFSMGGGGGMAGTVYLESADKEDAMEMTLRSFDLETVRHNALLLDAVPVRDGEGRGDDW